MSEGDLKELNEEAVELGVRRRAEYSDEEDGTLALVIPKREGGGEIEIALLEHARAVEEREDGELQDNTLVAIRPLAQLVRGLPAHLGGGSEDASVTFGMLRPGYLYVFVRDRLWRELEVGPDGRLSDVDLAACREQTDTGELPDERPAEGEWLEHILAPAMLQGEATLHKVRLAYSEIAWSGSYIRWLEADPARIKSRSAAINAAAAVLADGERQLSLTRGFPAGRLADVLALRRRDLGMELMLEAPEAFTPDFNAPAEDELCARLRHRWAQAGEDDRAASLDLQCEDGEDLLDGRRDNDGVIAVPIPDPLFALRHALAQIHLAQHYLDALDAELAEQPLGHSARLIRQALYAAPEDGGTNPLADYRDAFDTERLDAVLQQPERDATVALLNRQLHTLQWLASEGQITAVLRDFTSHHDLGLCEGYALCADLLGVLQQLPGVLHDHPDSAPATRARNLLQTLLTSADLQSLWNPSAPEQADATAPGTDDGDGAPSVALLRRLAGDDSEIDEARAEALGLETLGLMARNLAEQEQEQTEAVLHLTNAGRVGGLLRAVVSQWSQAVLRAVERVSDEVEVIRLQRLFTAVESHANLIDGDLGGELRIMRRGEVDLDRYTILGVHGDGLHWGLTDRDRASETLQTRRDYLFADQVDADGNVTGSTSPKRMSAEVDDAIRRVAGYTLVFVLPAGHPEAARAAQLRLTKVAEQARVVVDGPAISRMLVGFAIYNLGREASGLLQAEKQGHVALQRTRAFGAFIDLTAASMKLHTALYPEPVSRTGRFVQRPWFDMKNWPLIGARLQKVGASTLVRSIGIANFLAGVAAVGISAWELRISLQQGDRGAAAGHGVAVAGAALFVTAPLLTGLLLIPGWGWALLGLGLAIGGTSYAAMNQDTDFEQLLRQGPLGTHPQAEPESTDDTRYYPQLLTALSPVEIEVQRYHRLGADEQQALLASIGETAGPGNRDYVVTVRTPLISRFRIGPGESLTLAVQELTQTTATTPTRFGDQYASTYITEAPDPFVIGRRQLLPRESAVRFLVRRRAAEERVDLGNVAVSSSARLRIALQARIQWEGGEMVLPTPALTQYEPYRDGEHGDPPGRAQRTVNNPFTALVKQLTGRSQDPLYWHIQEFDL
ncbi:toxin VasX [Thioalkalivibrio sp. ALgr3]|uniref:toxin VasX n=1 Tax=Thioalkalivibrio sp. ALgr3 TaxID=1239292 RepID=UPI000378CE7D|nr:toxin VasX [Thioalkalivibrio sp. ALgr3]